MFIPLVHQKHQEKNKTKQNKTPLSFGHVHFYFSTRLGEWIRGVQLKNGSLKGGNRFSPLKGGQKFSVKFDPIKIFV